MSRKRMPVIVDVNTADVSELALAPYMNAVLAEHIVENRPYQRFEDLLNVKGMGARLLETMRPFLKISPCDVNQASIEELAAIPRLTRPMAEQIAAGRPYTDLSELQAIKGLGARTLELISPYLVAGEGTGAQVVDEAPEPPLIAVGETTGTQAVILPPEKKAETEEEKPEMQLTPPATQEVEAQAEPAAAAPHEKKTWASRAIQIIAPETTFPPRQEEARRSLTRGDVIAWGMGIGVLVMILSVVITLSILAIANGGLRFGSVQQVSAMQGDLQALQSRAEMLGQDVEGLRTRLNSLETMGGEISTLESQVETLDADLLELSGQVEDFQEQIDSINGEMTLIQQGYQQFEQFLNGLNDLMGDLFDGAP